MNAFFKTFGAALLAVVVANVLFVVVGVMILTGIGLSMMGGSPEVSVSAHSVLKIDLNVPVEDNPSLESFSSLNWMNGRVEQPLSLLDVLRAIDRAAEDKHIDGIYLNLSPMVASGMANLEEIRNALIAFKEKSGKFIIGYSDFYTQSTYYLASVADSLYLNPEGELLWKGLSSNVLFFKGTLEKLGVTPEVVRHGDFKAAVEPFVLDQMSPENRQQTDLMLSTIWGHIVGEIAHARELDSAQLQQYASSLAIADASVAVAHGMIDSLAYSSDVEQLLAQKCDREEVKMVSLGDYIASAAAPSSKESKNSVALIYATGDVVDGTAPASQIGSVTLARKLADARKDDRVKAVVVRVNSPGGSALAAEVIWHEMRLLQAQKPVIVSMGDVAASGGYYLAAPADAIMASPTTITGSIGVFGLLFNARDGLKNKLGITVDVAKTNPSADMGVPFREITSVEKQYLQHNIERVYKTFVAHVAEGRNLPVKRVDELGGGRVWSGVSALSLGLIDSWGGLVDALSLAADRGGVADDFEVEVYTDQPDMLSRILSVLSVRLSAAVPQGVATWRSDYENIQRILQREGVQAFMPYTFEIR